MSNGLPDPDSLLLTPGDMLNGLGGTTGLFIDIGICGTLEFLLPLFPLPPKYNLNFAEGPRRSCSSRIVLIVEGESLIEARDRSFSRLLATSVSKSSLGLEWSKS